MTSVILIPGLWQDVFFEITGGTDTVYFLSRFICMFAAATMVFAFTVSFSVKYDPNTSNKFSFWFMVADNIFRLLGVLILIAITVIQFEEKHGYLMTVGEAFKEGAQLDALIGTFLGGLKKTSQGKKFQSKLTSRIK